MSIQQIMVVMADHGIASYTQDGCVFADCNRTDRYEWVNVTGWSREAIYHWLGY